MLRTRLWMGTVLVLLALGVLVLDQRFSPYYPFLLALVLVLALAATYELLDLLGSVLRPPSWLCYLGVTAVVLSNWPAHLWGESKQSAWPWIAGTFAAVVLSAFLVEM